MTSTQLVVGFALAFVVQGCTFKAPDANKPLGCACDTRPNAYAYCKYDACNYAGCRAGFFDLDQDPSNGCEADRSELPGNLVFTFTPGDYVRWESEYITYDFKATNAVATATMADPTCKTTTAQECDFRLEGFQMSLVALPSSESSTETFSDAIVATTRPFMGREHGYGAYLTDPSAFSASFGLNGDRAGLLDANGSIEVLIYPNLDGTVRVSLSASFEGYIDDRKGQLTFYVVGSTPQLFDASVPDAEARDALADHDATPSDAMQSDATNSDAGDQ